MEPTDKANPTDTPAGKSNGSETPFFARFLEGQNTESKMNAAKPEAGRGTLKYPSDRDEWIDYTGATNDEAAFMTLKYPSDRDEIDRPPYDA